MKVYIAGPMTGIEDLNFPAFHSRAQELRNLGHTVVNPAEVNPDKDTPFAVCMKKDLVAMLGCDAILLLPGWERSRGATLEHYVGITCGMEIWYE